jgi:anti-sigma28 factor (negative regulator of flagellin synthesis)
MKVHGPKGIEEVERAPAPTDRAAKAPADKVTVGHQVAEVINASRSRAGGARAARIQQLEAAIQSGNFRADAGRIAEQLLNAAEIDAKIRAMLQR